MADSASAHLAVPRGLLASIDQSGDVAEEVHWGLFRGGLFRLVYISVLIVITIIFSSSIRCCIATHLAVPRGLLASIDQSGDVAEEVRWGLLRLLYIGVSIVITIIILIGFVVVLPPTCPCLKPVGFD